MAAGASAIALGAAVIDEGIRSVNFFNGRLVTSKDLGREQDARRLSDARIGQAIGPGIAWGLEAARTGSGTARTVRVNAGLAVNRAGQTLYLASDQTVSLTDASTISLSASGSGFGPCGVLSSTPYVAGDGLYLLTLAPAALQPEGKAEVLALDPGNVRCNTDAMVEAVQFRLLNIDTSLAGPGVLDTNAIGAQAVSRLRNRTAYACFGYPALSDAHVRPGVTPATTLLEAMRDGALSECDVPLAVVYITASGGIVFVDRWAVRRRVAADCAAPAWRALIGEEIDAIAEAQLVQFQDQLADLDTSAFTNMHAQDWFATLPPAGFLDRDGARRAEWSAFLQGQAPAEDVPLAPAQVRAVLAAALRRDPVTVGSSAKFRVYSIDDANARHWLFVSEARNSPHAEEVWLDGARAGLPDAADVQSAIDDLRAHCCRHIALWPGVDVQSRFAALDEGEDVVLCFEDGTYALSAPISLVGLGNVVVQGAGAGAVLRMDTGECALRIESCASATVTGLTFDARALGATGPTSGLNGALTILDTQRVRVEGVRARCGGTLNPTQTRAASIVVRNDTADTDAVVEIAGCETFAAHNQIGVLCVNTDAVIVRGNTLNAQETRAMARGIVIAGQVADDVRVESNVITGAVQGISVGLSESGVGAPLQAERVVVTNNTVGVELVAADAARNRFGVFVGNAQSVLVQGNRVRYDPDFAAIAWEAIRLTGVYGRSVIVRDNHVQGATLGVSFNGTATAGGRTENATHLWLVQYNVAERVGARPHPTAVHVQGDADDIALVEHNYPLPLL